jgi:hypothetical protein
MRLIFSRKGFDSRYGGVASPLLPDGTIFSLPIPSQHGRPLRGCTHRGIALDELAADLTGGRIDGRTMVHVDPDLDPALMPRARGWRAAFGQVSAAQAHLAKQNVGAGDLFLFFGWFRRVERHEGRWRYVPGARDIHSLFGWLQIGDVHAIDDDGRSTAAAQPWLRSHPHVEHAEAFKGRRNTIYVAQDHVQLAGVSLESLA